MLLLLAAFLTAGLGSLYTPPAADAESVPVLAPELEAKFVASPGHVVFGQYITSTNCGYCMHYGSPAHNKLKSDHPTNYTYVAYHSASYGDTDTAAAGNVAPIHAVSHLGETGGAPKSSFGDKTPVLEGCGSNTCWDTPFASGGNMHSSVSSYEMRIRQAENGANVDITIATRWIGSGSAPLSSYTLYAAVTEGTCSAAYTNGYHGGNCWKKWLTSSGNNTGFETISLSGSAWTYTNWTVSASTVSGGYSNMVTVGALMDGWSTNSANQAVYTAADSTMVPLVDVGLTGFSMTNQAGTSGWKPGDVIALSVSARNNGAGEYNDTGTLGFYHVEGQSETLIDSTSLNTLGSTSTQRFATTYNTTGIIGDPSVLVFRARLTNLVGDGQSVNNQYAAMISQDRAPEANTPVPLSVTQIERGHTADFEVTAVETDAVDTLEQMTPEFEVSAADSGVWSDAWVSGGDSVIAPGTTSARYEYSVAPPVEAAAGWYGVRVRFTDAGGQTSDWAIAEDVFKLLNGAPMIVADPLPTVRVQTNERVSLMGHVSDTETPLSQLSITSSSPSFVAWHAAREEIEVRFEQIQMLDGSPIPASLGITVSDGEATTTGSLQFNVIENGAPRWRPIPTQQFDEGGSVSLSLTQYLTDTDQAGNSVDPSGLNLSIRQVSNVSLIGASISGHTLTISAVAEDATGLANVTIRASDGTQSAEQKVVITINNVNDPPILDETLIPDLVLEVGQAHRIDLAGAMTDVDGPVSEIFMTASTSVPGAAQLNLLTGMLILQWPNAGTYNVTIQMQDRYAAMSTYMFDVEVLDKLPFVATSDAGDASADVLIIVDEFYVDTQPQVRITTLSDITFATLDVQMQLCTSGAGICHTIDTVTLELFDGNETITMSGTVRMLDELKVDLSGVDSAGKDRLAETMLFGPTSEFAPVSDAPAADGQAGLEGAGASVGIRAVAIALIAGAAVLVAALVAGLLMTMGRREKDPWAMAVPGPLVPADDTLANSMYGGAQDIFQQPAVPRPGPPLPSEGLPAGWTMEQWNHYGHQYLSGELR